MYDSNLRRWKVRVTLFQPWHELPGTYTAAEIWERKRNNEFKVAMPVFEGLASSASRVATFHIMVLDAHEAVSATG